MLRYYIKFYTNISTSQNVLLCAHTCVIVCVPCNSQVRTGLSGKDIRWLGSQVQEPRDLAS